MDSSPPVTFSYTTWIAGYPEFGPLDPAQGQAYFDRAAGAIVANSTSNPAYGDGRLSYLLYLATSHVAWLNCPKDPAGNPTSVGSAPSPLVGRISTASEGSVSVSAEYPLDGGASAQEKYLAQTRYGAELWAALAPYRTAQYAARPTIVAGGRFLSPLYNRFGRGFLR